MPVQKPMEQLELSQWVPLDKVLSEIKIPSNDTRTLPSLEQAKARLYKPGGALRLENQQLVKTQTYNLKLYGYGAFSVCAPSFPMLFHWS